MIFAYLSETSKLVKKKMALVIQYQVMHHYIQDSSILTLSYPGSRVDQLWSKLEDIAIITIILESRLSAAVFGQNGW